MTLCQLSADKTAYHYYRVTLQSSHLTELCLHVMEEGTFFPLLLILPSRGRGLDGACPGYCNEKRRDTICARHRAIARPANTGQTNKFTLTFAPTDDSELPVLQGVTGGTCKLYTDWLERESIPQPSCCEATVRTTALPRMHILVDFSLFKLRHSS